MQVSVALPDNLGFNMRAILKENVGECAPVRGIIFVSPVSIHGIKLKPYSVSFGCSLRESRSLTAKVLNWLAWIQTFNARFRSRQSGSPPHRRPTGYLTTLRLWPQLSLLWRESWAFPLLKVP